MSAVEKLAREILETRRLALGHATAPQMGYGSLDGGRIEFRDSEGNPVGGIGIGDDGGFDIIYDRGPKPPRPSVPVVTADSGIFRVEWDGAYVSSADGEVVLGTSDVDRVEIHASMDPNFVPDRVLSFAGAFSSLDGGSFTFGPLPEAGTYYFRLVARSKSKQFSVPSDRVEQELAIASMDLAVTDAWLTGDAAQTTADGKNTIWRGPDEPVEDPDAPFKDGDIWFEMTPDGKSIPNIWDDATGSWVANDDYRQSEIERVQQELRQDLDAVITDGSGTTNYYQGTPPDASSSPPPKEGDLWFDSSDKNKPYIYKSGAWVTVAQSFEDSLGVGDVAIGWGMGAPRADIFEGQITNISGFEFGTDPNNEHIATVPSGDGTGVARLYVPLRGSVTHDGVTVTDGRDPYDAGYPLGWSTIGNGADGIKYRVASGTPSATLIVHAVTKGGQEEIVPLPLDISAYTTSDMTHQSSPTASVRVVMSMYPTLATCSFAIMFEIPDEAGNYIRGDQIAAYAQVIEEGVADNAITTSKIAAGAITAESGIIGSINAGTITVGEMDGARIKAQTIAADRLLIGGLSPVNTNPEFDDGSTGWITTGTVTFSSGAAQLASGALVDSAKVPVTASEYRIRAITDPYFFFKGVSIYAIGTLADGGTEELLFGANRGLTDDTTGGVIGEYSFKPPATWTHVQVRAVTVGTAAKNVYGLSLYEGAGATLIQNGAVTTEKLAVGAITADSGIIGSIDANVITVGKIMGNQLDADAINGKTITGATIRTASSGSRVELTQNGLRQYNSLGATIVDMTGGSFHLQGGSITGSVIKTASSGSRVEITSNGLRQYDSAGSASLILDSGIVEVRNALSVSQTGRIQLLGTAGGPGDGENITMMFNRDQYGRAAIVGEDLQTGEFGGSIAWEDGSLRRGMVLEGPPGNALYDEYPLLVMSTEYTYLGMGGSDTESYIRSTRGTLNSTTTIAGGDVTVDVRSSSGRFRVPKVWSVTSTSGRPVRVNSSGTIFNDGSSLRYKEQVAPAPDSPNILDIEPKTWVDKQDVKDHERLEEFRGQVPIGPPPAEVGGASSPLPRIFGAIAEEVDAAGLSHLVYYDEYGRPDGLAYDKFGIALIPIVRELRDRIEELEVQLATA